MACGVCEIVVQRTASDPLLVARPLDCKCSRAPPAFAGQVASRLELDRQTAQQLDAPEFQAWPDGPVTLTPNPAVPQTTHQPGAPGPSGQWLRVNPDPDTAAAHAIQVDSDLFQGRVAVWLNGLPSTPAGLFCGKKRLSWVVAQGRFKKPIPVEELWTGQELGRPVKALPARWFVESVLLRIARTISSSMQVGPLSAPTLMSPLMALAQVVNVSLPGQAPGLLDLTEDCRLLSPALVDRSGAPMSADARRAHFNKAANRKGLVLSPDHVYTFHMWQQFIDLSTYKLDLGLYAYSLPTHLDGQPLQIMIKHCPRTQLASYLFNFQVWHKELLPALVGQKDKGGQACKAQPTAKKRSAKQDTSLPSDVAC